MLENSIHLTLAHHDLFNSDVTEASCKFYLWKRIFVVEEHKELPGLEISDSNL